MKASRLFLSLLIPASVVVAACSNPFSDLFNSPTTPSSSTSSTDTFNGSLTPNGSLVFTFSVATAGSVDVTLTAVSPATTAGLGLGVGPSSSGSCTISNSTSGAVAAGSPQLSAMETPGAYCVKVSDPGNLTATSAVTVTVAHP